MTLQTRLLAVHLLSLAVLAAGALADISTLATAGFAAAFLTLAALFVAMTGALVAGLRRRPTAILAAPSGRTR